VTAPPAITDPRHSPKRWRRARPHAPRAIPHPWRQWLLDKGSLTERLVAASGGDFRVQVLAQALRRPSREECVALGLPVHQVALVREVLLRGRDEPWVYARSVIPLAVLHGRYGFLRRLGTKPLGALLFRDAGIRRGAIEVTRRAPPRFLSAVVEDGPAWVRRSLFYLDQQPLLVAEMFLPGFSP